MNNELMKMCKELGIPVDDFAAGFAELKKKGYVCTPAKTAKQFGTWKYPYRLLLVPPPGLEKPSEVSTGPFPMKRESYERIRREITDPDAFRVFLGFVRLQYEKTGSVLDGFEVEAPDEPMYAFLGMMAMWDVFNPQVHEQFVWILPTDQCRRAVENITGRQYRKNDFSWWNVRVDMGAEFKPQTPDDYPERFCLIPSELLGRWQRYLSLSVGLALLELYSQMTTGGELKKFSGLEDLLTRIQKGLDRHETRKELDSSSLDRELLIKELLDFNNLTYPVDAVSMLEFLQQTGFVVVDQSHGKVEYWLADRLRSPKKVLKRPKGWESRMDKFLESNSLLLSYLTNQEIVDRM